MARVARTSKAPTTPAFIMPMAAESIAELPEGDDWPYEVKLDGYRALLIKDGDRIQIRSRNDKDLTRMYPRVTVAALKLNADTAVVDGEIVALDAAGKPSFQALQHRGENPGHQIVFYAFDVLRVDGRDVTDEPLTKRRGRLASIVGQHAILRLSQVLPGTAADVVAAVRAAGLEGVIAKRKDSIYQPGERSGDWLKLKLEHEQEFVIGGYGPDASKGVDALLVGYYEGRDLRFAGKVRTGMVPHVRRELLSKLKPLEMTECPFVNLPDAKSSRWGGGVTADQMSPIHWTRAKLLAQVRFVEWTAEGRLRHAAFLGLRDDKAPKDVRREHQRDNPITGRGAPRPRLIREPPAVRYGPASSCCNAQEYAVGIDGKLPKRGEYGEEERADVPYRSGLEEIRGSPLQANCRVGEA
jgi:bifunctional non-homologous end joining protein LigD